MKEFTIDDILVALCQKFGNSSKIINYVLDKKIYMADSEKEKYLNDIHESYISIFSNQYPVGLGALDDPPVCLFYDGNIDVFQNDIHVYENTTNETDMLFIGLVSKNDEVDWCIATTNQEDLQPILEEVFERLEHLKLKDYTQQKGIVLH